MWIIQTALTNHVEAIVEWHLRLGADLALVYAGIALLWRLDLQRPVLRLVRMDHLEPQVRRVHEDARAQDMHVPFAHPGHLRNKRYLHSHVLRKFAAADISTFSIVNLLVFYNLKKKSTAKHLRCFGFNEF